MAILNAKTVRRLFDYDYLTGHLLHRTNNGGVFVGSVAGYVKPCGRWITVERVKYPVRRLVWLWHNGTMPNGRILSKDKDQYDTHIENLVLKGGVTPRIPIVNGYSKFRGVTYSKKRGEWKACVRRKGMYSNLGYFSSYDLAVLARLTFEDEEKGNNLKVKYYEDEVN